jgi:hypothetical protein
VDQTKLICLLSSSKIVYMQRRRFLPCKHKYRQWKTRFDGTIENKETPKHQDGKFMFKMINNIKIVFGKPVKEKRRKKNEKSSKDSSFKKQSIFFRYLLKDRRSQPEGVNESQSKFLSETWLIC